MPTKETLEELTEADIKAIREMLEVDILHLDDERIHQVMNDPIFGVIFAWMNFKATHDLAAQQITCCSGTERLWRRLDKLHVYILRKIQEQRRKEGI